MGAASPCMIHVSDDTYEAYAMPHDLDFMWMALEPHHGFMRQRLCLIQGLESQYPFHQAPIQNINIYVCVIFLATNPTGTSELVSGHLAK